MARQQEHSLTIWQRILRETVPKLNPDDAVTLVGILFEYRFWISPKASTLLKQRPASWSLEPLEPTEAALVVAQLYGVDCDELFLLFHRNWSTLRLSPRVKGLIAAIESHEWVDHLEPCTDES